jgi:hypothetical protein
MLDEWAIAWSSTANTDPERVPCSPTTSIYEDVTSGAVVRGKEGLRRYLIGAFATIPDFTFGAPPVAAGPGPPSVDHGHAQGRLGRDAAYWQALFVGAGHEHPRLEAEDWRQLLG